MNLKTWAFAVGLGATVALGNGMAAMAEPAADVRHISVTGVARVAIAPTLARITLGVREDAKEAQIAMAAVSETMTDVLHQLYEAGIERTDIQTNRLSLQPQWEKDRSYNGQGVQKVVGFQAANTVIVTVRDLDQLGAVLDQVLQAGANQFQGLRFGVEDPDAVQDQIRGDAVRDARRKALRLAEAAEAELGVVRSIIDSNAGRHTDQFALREASSRAAMPIAPGELVFEHRVSVVFDLSIPTAN